MKNRCALLTLMLTAVLVAAWMSVANAGGPLSAPRCYLRSTNVYDRLQQVDYGDGITVYDSTHDCRRTNPSTGNYHMYFKLDDSYIYNSNYPIVHLAVTYWDSGTQPFALQYDGANNTFQSITIYRTNTNGWKTYTFDISDAKFANTQQGQFDFRLNDLNTSALYVNSVYVWCRKESTGPVSVSGNQFLNNGTRFMLVGSDYMQPWQTNWGNGDQAWGSGYSSTLVERDMANMELAGANAVRTFIQFSDYICPTEGTLNSTVLTHIQDFLTRATNHGVKVIFVVNEMPTWLRTRITNEYTGNAMYADYWTNFLYRKKLADYLVQLCNSINMGQYDSFMAFDLYNEPSFSYWMGTDGDFWNSLAGGPGISNATNRAWNRWVNAKYASLVNAYAAWGYQGPSDTAYTVYPEVHANFLASGAWDKKLKDYYAFVADSMVDTTNYVKSRVKAEALSRALFTIDFVSRGAYDNLTSDADMVELLCNDWRRCGKACDFMDFHLYNGYSDDPNWWRNQLAFTTACGTDKPVIMSEFGYPAASSNPTDLAKQSNTWYQSMNLATTAKLDGCMGWMWIDTSDTIPDATMGIRTVTDTAKSAWTQFTQMKTPFLTAIKGTPDRSVEVDVDSYVSPWQQFYSSGRSVIQGIFDGNHYPRVNTKYREYPIIDSIYHIPTQVGDPIAGTLGMGTARGAIMTWENIPDFMVSGLTYSTQIQTQNVGTATWTEASYYRLGYQNTYFGGNRSYLNAGESIPSWIARTFPMTLTAPAAPGTYTDTWRMVQDGVAWFGQGHTHSILVIAKPSLGAKITSFSIPQVVSPGSQFSASITVRNEGTSTWTESALVRLGGVGDSDPFAAARQYLAANDSIATGQSKTFSFTMTAPTTRGTYQTDWQMVQDGVAWFGQKIDVEVCVE